MALGRSARGKMSSSIWPGFVDAMTGLLLVLFFVLTIFMIVQFVLRETISGQEETISGQEETISGQEDALSALNDDVAALAQALGIERSENADLRNETEGLRQELQREQSETARLGTTITSLSSALNDAESDLAQQTQQLSALEAELAASLLQRDGMAAELEAVRIAAANEAALANARQTALEELAETLRRERVGATQQLSEALSDAEAQRLAEAEAATLLRARLAEADAELTAMTLSLEAARAEAEETLTLLAAARAAEADLDVEIREAQSQRDREAALLQLARDELRDTEQITARQALQIEALNQQLRDVRLQIGTLEALIDDQSGEMSETEIELDTLEEQLNAALIRATLAERRQRELEAAERARLEAEAEELQAYRSEFFGEVRQLLNDIEGIRIDGDRFVLDSAVLFAPGQATLSANGRDEMAKVADIFLLVANRIPDEIDWIIRVDGHTDNIPVNPGGRFSDNWELSQARALSVVRVMVEEYGLPPERLAANGFGEYRPVDNANTDAARARNRRIEFKLTER